MPSVPEPPAPAPKPRHAGVFLHWGMLLLVFGFLFVRSALEFTPHWDTLEYHLPSALSLYGLTTYEPEAWVQNMIEGLPRLAHRVQGFLILLTGRISAANLINPIALALSALVVWRVSPGSSSTRWYLTGAFAVPLVVLHTFCSYLDLWNGSFLAIAFILLVQVFRQARTGHAQIPPLTATAGCIIACAISFNSKYQAWPFVALLGLWLLIGIGLLWHREGRKTWPCLAVGIALTPLFLLHPWINAIQHNNPTHPIYNPVMTPENDPFLQNPTTLEAVKPQVPVAYWNASRPTRFVHSVFELTRTMPSKFPLSWSIDAGKNYPAGNATPHYRMGGWFFATVLVFLVTISIGLRKKILDGWPVAILLSLAALAAVLPQSHELRYWLVIPLAGCYLAAEVLSKLPVRAGRILKTALLICTGYVLWTTLAPFSVSTVPPADYAPKTAKLFWFYRARDMDDQTITITGARPMTIFWAGPDFNTFKVRGKHRERSEK